MRNAMIKLTVIYCTFNAITIAIFLGMVWLLCYSLYQQMQENTYELIVAWFCCGLIATHALWTMARDMWFPKDHPKPFTS